MVSVARLIQREDEDAREPANTLKRLLECEDRTRNTRVGCRDTIVWSDDGDALFRISYRNHDVHIVLPRAVAPAETIEKPSGMLKSVIGRDCRVISMSHAKSKGGYSQLQRFGVTRAEDVNQPREGDPGARKNMPRSKRSTWASVSNRDTAQAS
jgi:hypothetical protein